MLTTKRKPATVGEIMVEEFMQPEPWPRIGRPPKHDVEAWTVTDDWPAPVPTTDAELDVFKARFGDAARAAALLETSSLQSVTPQIVQRFARTARQRIRIDGGDYRRDHFRGLAQRVEVADREVRIIGSKTTCFRR